MKNLFKNKFTFNHVFKFSFSYKIKKDDIFTISLIGRPNVGKSTLINRLAGERLSLVDSTPGMTRDRKETIIKMFDVPIRLVDTAGVEDFEENPNYNDIINKTIDQTRKALVYSDLALFMVDGRQGITYSDYKLAEWINKNKDKELKYEFNKTATKGIDELNQTEKNQEEFYEKMKELKGQEDYLLKIPNVVLIVNKVEDNFIPCDVYENFSKLNLGDPMLISAEHGDNMHDIYNLIEENLPTNYKDNHEEKIQKRIKRYFEYKERLKIEFLESIEKLNKDEREKYSVEDWEKDFDFYNKRDVEDNSDYDSDNDIDPIDTIADVNAKMSQKNKKEISQNRMNAHKNLKRPIKIAVVGKQNVGKSSIINSLLKENRVVISDIPGTTRDAIPIQWVHKGRRIVLIDTAGLKEKSKVHERIDKMASAATIKAIKFSHVVVYVIDSMQAFTAMDMKLIDFIGEEGRACIIVANKWDLVENGFKTKAKKWMEDQLDKGCTHYKNVNIHFVSAKNFLKVDYIMDDIINAYAAWNKRLSTYLINQWTNQLKKISVTPGRDGGHLKIKFMTQVKTRPPCFTVFVNDIKLFFKSHENFIKKLMVKEFGLKFAPLRFLVRDHVKIFKMNEFKKVTTATAKIQKKIDLMKKKMANPTYRRKMKGSDLLYGKKSLYRQMKK